MRRIGLITDDAPRETPETFVCPHCGKDCRTAAELKAHVRKEHPDALDEDKK
jgi:uncharacterized C2H2 Zn-finger protein